MLGQYTQQISMIAGHSLPSPDSTCSSDAESEITHELEQKRRQLDQEIATFQLQKAHEFRNFKTELKATRKRMEGGSPTHHRSKLGLTTSCSMRPSKSSSSSALDLLAGHGSARRNRWATTTQKAETSQTLGRAKNQYGNKSDITTSPLLSKPTLSLEPLNIQAASERYDTNPATPALLVRQLSRSSSTSSIVAAPTSGLLTDSKVPSPTSPEESTSTSARHSNEALIGVITPAYLPLLEAKQNPQFPSPSSLATPPVDEHESQTRHGMTRKNLTIGVLPLQSSSFPPTVAKLASTSPSTKRAYTSPATVGPRKPSALRSTSTSGGTTMSKKRKHVTLRLADSAIVEPSSSYEEGPSPLGREHPAIKTLPAVTPTNRGARSPLRYTAAGGRSSLIGDHTRSDEDDAAAGVVPGMNMGEVMQKLNEFSIANGTGDEVACDDDEEDVGWIDTKYHEDDDDEDDDDNGIVISGSMGPVEQQTDSYFSPRSRLVAAVTPPSSAGQEAQCQSRDQSGSSPLEPYRDHDWSGLSSTDKDRLLFRRRTSDDEDSDSSHRDEWRIQKPTALSGLKKTGSHGSLTSLAKLAGQPKIGSRRVSDQSIRTTVPVMTDNLRPSVDGGSGVGFFELDEELASPGSQQADSIDSDDDLDDLEISSAGSAHEDGRSLDTITEIQEQEPSSVATFEEIRSTFGVGSMPIDIMRPSVSVSSSWRGTFGH